MKLRHLKILFYVLFIINTVAEGQTNLPFWNNIQNFKKQDSIAFPVKGQILFIGSSSFTLWKDVQNYFPDKKILNRAFGGSTLADQIQYRYEVIYAYDPKQIVMYCGENDFASSDTVTVDWVVERFKTLFHLIRQKYPSVSFVYVSMKPSPSRKHLMKKYEAANNIIQQYLKTQPKTVFVDVYHQMLKADGDPMEDIFLEDNLHMNVKGYAIWKKLLLPVLKK